MKKYILNKDIPTFKKGTECHIDYDGNLICNTDEWEILAYTKQTLEKFPNILGDWFKCIREMSTKEQILNFIEVRMNSMCAYPLVFDVERALQSIYDFCYEALSVEENKQKRKKLGWLSVYKVKPEVKETVILYSHDIVGLKICLWYIDEFWEWYGTVGKYPIYPDFWQPLPLPPKE